jgi:predicted double-glycine peptidase
MPILNIPHLYQNAPTAPNRSDCGQTCCGMLIHAFTDKRPTVGQIATATKTDHNGFTNFVDLIRILAYYGVQAKMCAPKEATLEWHEAMLFQGRPTIALVAYDQLPSPVNYKLAHFLVVVGFDEQHVYLNDPLQNIKAWRVTREEFRRAIDTPSRYSSTNPQALNPSNLALYPKAQLMTTITGANLDLTHNLNPSADAFVKSGLKAARIEMNVSGARAAEGIPHSNTDLNAFNRLYKPYITTLRAGGVRVFGCITHRTWGEGKGEGRDFVWYPTVYNNDNEARRFINGNVAYSEPIVREYIGLIDDWLLGNENDAKPEHARASIPLKPHQYGLWIKELSAMIRRVNPRARVWVGEFVTGTGVPGGSEGCIPYLQKSGLQPGEYYGISFHPYDMTNLKSYLAAWKRFTHKPLAITEFGPLGTPEEQATWNTDSIFRMIENYVSTAVGAGVEALIKYSWANTMDNGYGIVDASGRVRRDSKNRTLFDILKAPMLEKPTQPETTPVNTPIKLASVPKGGIRIRSGAGLKYTILGTLKDDQPVEPKPETVMADGYRWRRFIVGGLDGYIAVEGNGISLTLKP